MDSLFDFEKKETVISSLVIWILRNMSNNNFHVPRYSLRYVRNYLNICCSWVEAFHTFDSRWRFLVGYWFTPVSNVNAMADREAWECNNLHLTDFQDMWFLELLVMIDLWENVLIAVKPRRNKFRTANHLILRCNYSSVTTFQQPSRFEKKIEKLRNSERFLNWWYLPNCSRKQTRIYCNRKTTKLLSNGGTDKTIFLSAVLTN